MTIGWPEGREWARARRFAGPWTPALVEAATRLVDAWDPRGTVLVVLGFEEADVCQAERTTLLAGRELDPATEANLLYEEMSDFAYLRSLPSLQGQHVARALGGAGDAMAVTSGWTSAVELGERILASSDVPCVLVCGPHDGDVDAVLLRATDIAPRQLRPVRIASVGAITPLGASFPQTLAALHAGGNGVVEAPWLAGLGVAPALGNVTAMVSAGPRAVAMAQCAIAEALNGRAPGTVPTVIAPMWDGDLEAVFAEADLGVEATCSGGIRALAEACRIVASGEAEEALAVAVVARNNPLHVSQFAQLTALSHWQGEPAQASRPFDRQRDGMVMAEAAVAVLVSAEAGEVMVAGSGWAHDHAHPTAPSQACVEVAAARALAGAGIRQPDVVSVHGTGTRLNDATEAAALTSLLGAGLGGARIESVKAVTGHASSASSLLEVALLADTLISGRVPPIAHCPEPDVDLPLSSVASTTTATTGLSLSFGFGGQHAAIVLTVAP